jgi:hypothetical protein
VIRLRLARFFALLDLVVCGSDGRACRVGVSDDRPPTAFVKTGFPMGLSVVPYHHKNSRVAAVEITQFRRDASVKCYLLPSGSRQEPSKRGSILGLSERSRQRFLFQAFNASCDWFAYIVLTYPKEFPNDGKKVREHRRQFGQWLTRHGYKFMTFLEFQKRGAPHLNVIIDGWLDKDLLSKTWFDVVGSGDPKHLLAGTRIEFCGTSERVQAYAAACYSAEKKKQKTVPDDYKEVGRFWTSSRGLVRPVKQAIGLPDKEMLSKVRILRKYTESQIKPRRCQPMKDSKLRKRKVKRKCSAWLHYNLQGFKSFNGGKVVERLFDGEVKDEISAD